MKKYKFNRNTVTTTFLINKMKKSLYISGGNESESVQVIAKYQVGTEPRFIYFFKEGSLVAWNVSDLEVENLLEFLKQYEIKPYEKAVVVNEKELMYYTYNPNT